MHWLEVETKVRVKDVDALKKKIRKIAVFKKRETRDDDYFSLQRKGYPRKSFRIRYDGKKFIVNFKKHLKNLWSDGIVVKREFEFEFSDKKNFDNFFALLEDFGFTEWLKKRKHIEKYSWKRDARISIEINKVDEVGNFMEIEYLAQPHEVEIAKKKIAEVLRELDVKKNEIDNVGYTRRMFDNGIFNKKDFIIHKLRRKNVR